jgi:hypothetical protein
MLVHKPIVYSNVEKTQIINSSLPGKNPENTSKNSTPALNQNTIPFTPSGIAPASTENVTLSSQVAVTGTTPASPLSVIGTGVTLSAAAMIVVRNKRREKNL